MMHFYINFKLPQLKLDALLMMNVPHSKHVCQEVV